MDSGTTFVSYPLRQRCRTPSDIRVVRHRLCNSLIANLRAILLGPAADYLAGARIVDQVEVIARFQGIQAALDGAYGQACLARDIPLVDLPGLAVVVELAAQDAGDLVRRRREIGVRGELVPPQEHAMGVTLLGVLGRREMDDLLGCCRHGQPSDAGRLTSTTNALFVLGSFLKGTAKALSNSRKPPVSTPAVSAFERLDGGPPRFANAGKSPFRSVAS
jgi:hypothetical protein